MRREVFGPRPNDTTVHQTELGHHLGQEGGPAQQGLDQDDRAVRAGQRQRDARQPGAAADIGDHGSGGTKSPTTAQFNRWRVQTRAASRGPISPRSTPGP